ncbi:MAG: LPS-assembly protein LptD [Rhodospirillales bacterium]|nr:LPS-assembly protein LptD [Rhodospirillales bacterium]MCB9995555.1 LPS-assembly protein LptD [Rhodospirillales bacterium]
MGDDLVFKPLATGALEHYNAYDEYDFAGYSVTNGTTDVFPVVVSGSDDPAVQSGADIPAPPQPAYVPEISSQPVDLEADSLQHDEASGILTAAGHVELVQGKRILRADRVSYNLNSGTVIAKGNVSLNEPNGDLHFADEVELGDEMKNGFVRGLQTYLADGGHFTAEEGQRINETLIKMHNATYTPCECEADEDGDPAWQIRAEEVTLDEEEHRVKYKNARFELYGTPVLWSPYLAHPDGKVKRKSGFLSPQVGYDSQLGFVVTENYYWDIAPNKDMTLGAMLTSKENPVALAQYRQRFEQADLLIEGSATKSDRNDSVAGQEVITDDEFRGHLFANSRWSMNEKWRSGLDLELTTDDQYLREYDFSGKDVLENQLFVERFSGRNYAVGRLLAFQDVRVEEERTDQPNVLPEIELNFLGEPNQTMGGRWQAQASALQLHREDGQDMVRLVGQAGWQRQFLTRGGLMNTVDLSVRGDLYHVNDRDVATFGSGRSNEGEDSRVLPRAHWVSRYPLVKPMQRLQAVIEPVAALTLAPDIDDVDSDIPNEDSQDVQLDASNLFSPDRFPGKDRLEDQSRVTYGLRSGLYGYGGSYGSVFLGQSYRFDEDDNPFPAGSGLERRESDWVGQIAGAYKDDYGINYRTQLDGNNFTSRRHEVDGFADFGRLDISSRYLFAKALEGTDIEESREQIYGAAGFDVTRNWRIRGSVLEDLGSDPGLREATFGLDYTGCCLSFSATVERNITSDVSGDSGTDVKFRVGLKGLGEFQNSSSAGFSGSN